MAESHEGNEAFAVERLLPVIELMSKTHLYIPSSGSGNAPAEPSSLAVTSALDGPHRTICEIAEKFEVEDWTLLVLVACYHLSIVRQLGSYSQEQILEKMLLEPNCSRHEMDRALRRILKELEKTESCYKRKAGTC